MVCGHWRPKPLQNVSKMAKLCQMHLLTSVTLETLLKHFGDYKTFLHDSKHNFFTHSFDMAILRYCHVMRHYRIVTIIEK